MIGKNGYTLVRTKSTARITCLSLGKIPHEWKINSTVMHSLTVSVDFSHDRRVIWKWMDRIILFLMIFWCYLLSVHINWMIENSSCSNKMSCYFHIHSKSCTFLMSKEGVKVFNALWNRERVSYLNQKDFFEITPKFPSRMTMMLRLTPNHTVSVLSS